MPARLGIIVTLAALVVAASFASALWHPIGRASAQVPGLSTPTRRPVTPSPTPTPKPAPPPVPAPAVGPGIMVAECRGTTPNSVRVIFLWGPSRSGPQWLDLSIFNDNFRPGRFVTIGGLDANRYAVVWDGILQGTTHYARINTLTSQGWKTSKTLMFYTPVCGPDARNPAPAGDMLALRDQMAAAVYRSGINTAVAVTDLRTGETVDVNGAGQRLPGCTINLFALIDVATELQAGAYPEPQPGDLIAQTINRSDPVTARTLTKYWLGRGDLGAGITRVNDFVHGLGMTSTLMDHPPAFPEESLYGGGPNRITALDSNRGLRALWDGLLLDPWWRDYMLYKMTLVKPGLNYLIAAGAGYGATVSHKNGFLWEGGWADNDVGIVWYERGGQRYGYAISFFTEGVRNKYDDIPMGQTVASQAYQWFVNRYGYP